MAAFNTRRARRPGAARPRSAPAAARLRPPPSSALINAVLEYADLRDELGGGRVLLRLSPARIAAESRLCKRLGAEAARLGDVAVIWDDRDDVIFRVLDGAPPALALVSDQPAPGAAVAEPDEDDHFVLTPAALDYIAQSQSRGRG